MTYIVNEACIKCKYMDCIEVCPVDCFYEGENMLVIHPDECIDCGVCEPECPPEAILPDTDPGALSPARAWRRPTPTSTGMSKASSKSSSAPIQARAANTKERLPPPQTGAEFGSHLGRLGVSRSRLDWC